MTSGQVDQVIEFTSLDAMDGFIAAMGQMAKNIRKTEATGIRQALNFYIGSMPGVVVGMPGKVTVQVGEVVRSADQAAAECRVTKSHPNPPNPSSPPLG